MKKNKMIIKGGKINFSCRMDSCRHQCCGPFCGITNSLASIDGRPFDEIVLTDEDYDRLYQNGSMQLVESGVSKHMGKRYYKMALEEDGTCKAFQNGLCTIHAVKPTLCRAFPFYFDLFSGLCSIECEGFSEEHWTDLKDYEGCFEAARQMYRFWIDFYSRSDSKEDENESE